MQVLFQVGFPTNKHNGLKMPALSLKNEYRAQNNVKTQDAHFLSDTYFRIIQGGPSNPVLSQENTLVSATILVKKDHIIYAISINII